MSHDLDGRESGAGGSLWEMSGDTNERWDWMGGGWAFRMCVSAFGACRAELAGERACGD